MFIGDAYSVESRRNLKNVKLTRALNEITTPNECLTDDSINCFIELVNKKYNGTFEMADILLYQVPEFYKELAKNATDDVQILYGGRINDVKAIGHYICIFYKHTERRVYIYDSLFTQRLTDTQQQIVKFLYPLAKYQRFVKPKTLQPDSTSCGVFSIAYATTLILGRDPKHTSFKLNGGSLFGDRSMSMRHHIKQMLTSGYVSLFPA